MQPAYGVHLHNAKMCHKYNYMGWWQEVLHEALICSDEVSHEYRQISWIHTSNKLKQLYFTTSKKRMPVIKRSKETNDVIFFTLNLKGEAQSKQQRGYFILTNSVIITGQKAVKFAADIRTNSTRQQKKTWNGWAVKREDNGRCLDTEQVKAKKKCPTPRATLKYFLR